jgi:hypothetical protein
MRLLKLINVDVRRFQLSVFGQHSTFDVDFLNFLRRCQTIPTRFLVNILLLIDFLRTFDRLLAHFDETAT